MNQFQCVFAPSVSVSLSINFIFFHWGYERFQCSTHTHRDTQREKKKTHKSAFSYIHFWYGCECVFACVCMRAATVIHPYVICDSSFISNNKIFHFNSIEKKVLRKKIVRKLQILILNQWKESKQIVCIGFSMTIKNCRHHHHEFEREKREICFVWLFRFTYNKF